jgi:predicted RNA-binding Zn ribbon-like protein
VRLGPAAEGVAGVLGEVLAAVALADRDGTWRRLKLCREQTCQAVFYDRSKNGSRCWCSMEVCGNRNKTRAYRSRRTARTPDADLGRRLPS